MDPDASEGRMSLVMEIAYKAFIGLVIIVLCNEMEIPHRRLLLGMILCHMLFAGRG